MKHSWVCRLNELMEKRGITQRDLSFETGISASALSRLQNNNFLRMDLNTLNTLADYFEIKSGDELFECVITQEDGK